MHCNLNSEQIKAALHGTGPAMILAGPGSGKTTVLIERLKYLVLNQKVEPSKILMVTFTRAAAGQMRQRFLFHVNHVYYPINFGTFHSVFYRILKESPVEYSNYKFISEKEKYTLMSVIKKKFNIQFPDAEFPAADLLIKWISVFKNKSFLDFENEVYINQQLFNWLYKQYNDELRNTNKIDFDDLAPVCIRVFENSPEILKKWQSKFEYIMIDEFQDINEPQYKVIKMLADKHKNLYVVGDDDQSIYSFRGSNPMIIQQFLKDFPDCFSTVLSINYRSSYNIVKVAEMCIRENSNRIDKCLKASFSNDFPVILKSFNNKKEELDGMIQKIREWNSSGVPFQDIAVISRTNFELDEKAGALSKEHIPYFQKERRVNIYEHFIIKDMEAYFRLALGEYKRRYFFQIRNLSLQDVPRSFFCRETVSPDELKSRSFCYESAYCELQEFEKHCDRLKKFSTGAAIRYVRNIMKYDKNIEMKAHGDSALKNQWMSILNSVQKNACEFRSLRDWLEMIDSKRNEENNSEDSEHKNNGIQLLTMHGSKGLEFDKVIITDVNEGVIPQGKCLSEEQIEDERRMFYVAMTRAKTELEIYYVGCNSSCNKKMPSRFLNPISGGHLENTILHHQ